jgi:4-methyl-5(b-hydroxyethyl)-thiazole monophosphate biosynthesis
MFPFTALILIAPGFETEQALVPLNYFTRAGIATTVARIGTSNLITDMANITYNITTTVSDVNGTNFSIVVVPGGSPGSQSLAADPTAVSIIRNQANSGGCLASIGGATGVVLAGAAGVVRGKKVCTYPGTEENVSAEGGILLTDPIVIDGNLVTAAGSGVVQAFALAIVGGVVGDDAAQKLAEDLQIVARGYPTPTDLPWQSETNWKAVAIICTVLTVLFAGIVGFTVYLYARANKPGPLDRLTWKD